MWMTTANASLINKYFGQKEERRTRQNILLSLVCFLRQPPSPWASDEFDSSQHKELSYYIQYTLSTRNSGVSEKNKLETKPIKVIEKWWAINLIDALDSVNWCDRLKWVFFLSFSLGSKRFIGWPFFKGLSLAEQWVDGWWWNIGGWYGWWKLMEEIFLWQKKKGEKKSKSYGLVILVSLLLYSYWESVEMVPRDLIVDERL